MRLLLLRGVSLNTHLFHALVHVLVKKYRRAYQFFGLPVGSLDPPNHRYWDVRRWMIGPSTLGGMLRGVKFTREANGTFKYVPYDVEKRLFLDKMYLYPIPQSEIIKTNGSIEQNPGWN